jgi:hemerythrin-like domain-containing protein
MRTNEDGPADTRMMGIVHDALRRDLARVRAALACPVPPAQRRALAAHVDWMMDFLHEHHEGEDAGLYPMVRAINPAAGALLDAMAADHARVDPAVAGVRAAAARWAADDAERAALLDAITALEDVLLPHLEREENEAMPVVSATITTASGTRGTRSTTSSPSRCRSSPRKACGSWTGSTRPGARSWRPRCRGCRG